MNVVHDIAPAALRAIHHHLAAVFLFLLFFSSTLIGQSRDVADRSSNGAPASSTAAGVDPCMFVDDLDFGILAPGQVKSLPIRICNNGRDELVLNDPWLTWVTTEFSVSQADIDRLKAAKLKNLECVEIMVTFSSNRTGSFNSSTRFWSNTAAGCRDVSTWKAIVTRPVPFLSSYDWRGRWLTTENPCTRSTTREYVWDIYTYNAGDRDFVVRTVKLRGADADSGYFRFDNSNPATTIRPGDVMKAGDTAAFRRLQRVIFTPKEERVYSCETWLATENGDTVVGFLMGSGIESHVAVQDVSFGDYQFVEPGADVMEKTAMISAPKSSRPTTITGVRLDNVVDFTIIDIRRTNGTVISVPFTLAMNEEVEVNVAFHPQTADPHVREGHLIVDGDFSRCDDSVALLRAGAAVAGIAGERRLSDHAVRVSPNPVAAVGTISLELEAGMHAIVEIFDGAGERVASLLDRMVEGGRQELRWDAGSLPSGIYYCRITAGRTQSVRPILVMH